VKLGNFRETPCEQGLSLAIIIESLGFVESGLYCPLLILYLIPLREIYKLKEEEE
jgi:hypothetical protein